MSATVKVVLHGRLKKFGGPYDWGVASPNAAIRALCTMCPGFQGALSEGQYRVIRGSRKEGAHLTAEMLNLRLAPGTEFHIVPAAKGSGGGAGKIILGVILIAGAFFTGGATLPGLAAVAGGGAAATAAAGSLVAGVAAGIALKVGVFLILDGVAQLLSPHHTSTPSDAALSNSFTLSPPGNTAEQGNPIPLVYGTVRIGSVQVSAGYSANEIAIGLSAPVGSPYSLGGIGSGYTGGYLP